MAIQQDANNYMQKINKISQTFPEILVMLFQRNVGMLDHAQLKRHDNTVASLDVTSCNK